MKIIIATTMEPFVNGGANLFADWLEEKLKEYGHQAEALRIPFSMNYKVIMEQMTALRLYHLEEYCDRLIAIRTPAYLVQHSDKYLWFIHHYREMYDLWDTEYNGLPRTDEVKSIREYVKRADDLAFAESKKIYTNSKVITDRLMEYNHVKSEPLYPPLLHPEKFHCEEYGDFIYYSSRMNGHKRQLLAIQAMKFVKTGVKLVLTGKTGDQVTQKMLINEINSLGLQNKITLIDEWISEESKADYYSRCLAGLYIPFDEDSYGYPSLEAHHSGKAVISCLDSGGTKELINDGYNGFLVEPSPEKLAECFDKLFENKKLAEEMGANALKRLEELDISWDHVIRRFTV